jgi:acetoin utilization deacetylase AcuC-like enzyme
LVRAWTRIRRAVQPRRIEFIYSPDYRLSLGGTPIDAHRGEKILSFLLIEGLIGRRSSRAPQRASLKTLGLVHTDDYLDRLHHHGALVPIVGFSPGDEIQQRALEAQRSAVGGTKRAARIALQRNKIVFNLGGGFHHARPASGRGFCIFNDIAVAIRVRRAKGFEGPILVIDLDLHDGDGTRAVFADDPSVFTFSIHNRHWDDAAATASESIELENDVSDAEYLEVVEDSIPRLIDAVRPELVFYVAGTDPAHDDPLGNWKISDEGMLARDRIVFSTLTEKLGDVPTVVTLAGGYGNRTWRYTARSLSWLLTGKTINPPSNEALTLARYRKILAHLEPAELREESGDLTAGAWDISDEDIWGDLMGQKRSSRLLGHFSLHGVELVLERCGLLDRLREAGFKRPHVEFDLGDPAGETVRVFGASKRRELLVEVRLRRETRAVPDQELLSIEWLLMQNPRLEFGTEHHQLPGQNHPGLGLLNDMMALLIMMCEQLKIDGLSFVPSHYHLATKGQRFLRFLEPEDAAYFGALQDAVEDLPLRHATRAIDDGRVVDGEGNEAGWRPMIMVLAVSEQLKDLVDGEEYENAVRKERRKLDLRLVEGSRS